MRMSIISVLIMSLIAAGCIQQTDNMQGGSTPSAAATIPIQTTQPSVAAGAEIVLEKGVSIYFDNAPRFVYNNKLFFPMSSPLEIASYDLKTKKKEGIYSPARLGDFHIISILGDKLLIRDGQKIVSVELSTKVATTLFENNDSKKFLTFLTGGIAATNEFLYFTVSSYESSNIYRMRLSSGEKEDIFNIDNTLIDEIIPFGDSVYIQYTEGGKVKTVQIDAAKNQIEFDAKGSYNYGRLELVNGKELLLLRANMPAKLGDHERKLEVRRISASKQEILFACEKCNTIIRVLAIIDEKLLVWQTSKDKEIAIIDLSNGNIKVLGKDAVYPIGYENGKVFYFGNYGDLYEVNANIK